MGDFAAEAISRDIDLSDYDPEDPDFDDWEIPCVYVTYYEGDRCSDHSCSGHFVMRINGKTKEKFLGCSNFPKCKRNTPYTVRKIKIRKKEGSHNGIGADC